jgi:UDP:flavonoid glycosyltransferase YjiC (YdhE family)
MTVVFFISGHGFGHASRDVEVINALGALVGPDLRVIVRSAVSPALLERTIRVPFELRPGICDTGLVQTNSVTQDDAATLAAAREFYRTFDDRVRAETAALAGDRPSVIVSDIAPLGLAVAAALGVPSVFIANFTWDWIYEGFDTFRTGAPEVLAAIRRAQSLATVTLKLPLSPSFDGTGLTNIQPLPLIARRSTHPRDETRALFGLPADRKVALLSFGGYGLSELDLTHVDAAGEWHFVVTDRTIAASVRGALPYVHALSEHDLAVSAARYEDLVAASDAVITKPGFGILGECIAASTPILYTSRGHFREYDVLVAEMPRYLRSKFLSQEDLFAGRWRTALAELIAQPAPKETLAPTGAEAAAAIISSMSSRTPAGNS